MLKSVDFKNTLVRKDIALLQMNKHHQTRKWNTDLNIKVKQ